MVMSKERGQAAIARNLGIGLSTLHKWLRKARGQASTSAVASTTEKTPEVKRLEAEIRRLKLEQEILKKVMAFFAKDHA